MSSNTALPVGRAPVTGRLALLLLTFLSGLVPFAMAIGIISWGGWDYTIAVPLAACVLGLIGLLISLICIKSDATAILWTTLISVGGILCVTMLFLAEHVFFRDAKTPLLATVPVFRLDIPVVFLYGLTLLICSSQLALCVRQLRQ